MTCTIYLMIPCLLGHIVTSRTHVYLFIGTPFILWSHVYLTTCIFLKLIGTPCILWSHVLLGHIESKYSMCNGTPHPILWSHVFRTLCTWRSHVYWDTLYLMSVQLGEQSYLLNVAWDDCLKMLSQSSWFYWNFLTIEYFLW